MVHQPDVPTSPVLHLRLPDNWQNSSCHLHYWSNETECSPFRQYCNHMAEYSAHRNKFLLFLLTKVRYHVVRSEEHTSELQSRPHLVCRLLLEKKKNTTKKLYT